MKEKEKLSSIASALLNLISTVDSKESDCDKCDCKAKKDEIKWTELEKAEVFAKLDILEDEVQELRRRMAECEMNQEVSEKETADIWDEIDEINDNLGEYNKAEEDCPPTCPKLDGETCTCDGECEDCYKDKKEKKASKSFFDVKKTSLGLPLLAVVTDVDELEEILKRFF